VTYSTAAIFSGIKSSLTISPLTDADQLNVVLPNLARALPPLLPDWVTLPTSVPDCGRIEGYELPGIFGPDYLEVRSVLKVEVEPQYNYRPPYDHLGLRGAPQPVLGGRLLEQQFDCPVGRVTGTGTSARTVGLRLYALQERLQRYAYDLRAEYKVQIFRVPGDSIYRDLAREDGRGIPCTGGFFPICKPDDFGRVETPLPGIRLQPGGCQADGCPDHFVFSWQGSDTLKLNFLAPLQTSIEVVDAFGTLIARAFPAKPTDQISLPPLTNGLVSLPGWHSRHHEFVPTTTSEPEAASSALIIRARSSDPVARGV